MHDLVVIGGGVWGTTAALAAVERGVGRVALLESNPFVAGESSGKSGGIMSAFAGHPDDRAWVAASRARFEEAARRTGDLGMIRRHGRLVITPSAEVPRLQQVADELRGEGVESELLEPAEVRRRFPLVDGLGPGTAGLWSPDAWHVNGTAYAQAALAAARDRGLEVRLGCRVRRIRITPAGIRLELPDGSELAAARVLIAAGTWTRKLLQTAGIDIPYRPYRVQLASVAFAASMDLPIMSETATDMYITPDGPGSLLAGDGTQLWEHDPDTFRQEGDPDFERDIAAGLLRLMSSAAAGAQLRRSWAGLCGATPDRRPLIGAVADGLCIACGDNGSGIGRGPGLGELAAAVALGEAAAPHLDPFRFPPGDFRLRPGSGFIVPD